MSEEFVPKSDRRVNKAPIIICSVIAAIVVLFTLSVRFVFPFITGVFIKDDITDIVETTYEFGTGDNVNYSSDVKGEVNSIKMDLKACSVNIKVAEGNGLISAEYSGEKRLKPEISLENGKLVITQKGGNFRLYGISTSFNKPMLNIVLGNDVKLDEIEIKSNAGDINFDGISADYFYGDFNAGNIVADNCTFRKFEIDTDAGNIQIDDSDLKIVKIDTDAGNIQIKNTSLEDVEINTDFGNVEIKGIDDIDAYDIECSVDAGIVNVDNSSFGNKYQNNGSGSGSIRIDVDAGNIEIN